MTQPFFSVVIPTRNRADLLLSAVTSVLNQTFSDYELIVSDNSDDTAANQNLLQSLNNWEANLRCSYIRPENYMLMPDHWEFCTNYASGVYVVILTDRFVMRPSALEVLAERIKSAPNKEPDIILWNVQSEFSDQSGIQHTQRFAGKSESIDSKLILDQFASFSSWKDGSTYFNKLPRGMNSVYRRSLASEIKMKHGRMFPPLSPDYSSAFLFLAYAKDVLYIDLPFYMSHGNLSTGSNSMIFGIHMLDAEVDPLEGCPLKIDTVFNSVVRDLLAVKALVAPRMQEIKIDVVGYYLSNYRELIHKELIGSPMNLKPMYELWFRGLESLPKAEQEGITTGKIFLDEMRINSITLLRYKLTRSLGLFPLRNYVLALLAKRKHIRMGGATYSDALDAAQATDHHLK
jgi:glycosyltransferase involved in cell wall biosynthesis